MIAALETLLLWYQDRRLKNHRPGGWMRVLPPLQHTESLLFQTIGLGFVLLTIALITGLVFINQFFSMASPQRTLLFIAAWVIFGGLLLARWRLGWRGRIAIRWTLSGFAILVMRPRKHILPQSPGGLLAIHIFISLIATSLFVIAALETLLLWYQDRRLKNHRPGGWMRVLPPLQHTESLLFQTIGLGFVLLTIALITGLVFINQFFSMASPQRTLLFIAAWVIFGGLLLARWRLGWRGRIAIRWTLSGFAILVIAYFSVLLFRLFSI